MGYNEFILMVNGGCIALLLFTAITLLFSTRFRGANGYAAVIAVVPCIPIYLYNMSRMLGWHEFTYIMFPLGYSVNTTLMPIMWLFALYLYKPSFKLKPIYFLHFIPSIICLIVALFVSREFMMETISLEASGVDNWIGDTNAVIISTQIVVYFIAIFIYIRKQKRYFKENCSDAEYLQKEWFERYMIVFATIISLVMITYVIYPRCDAWLTPILNTIGIIYLAYSSMAHPELFHVKYPDKKYKEEPLSTSKESEEEMRLISYKVTEYLGSTKAYLHSDLSLAELAKECGLSQKALSRSINSHLGQNFFELVNKMRVEMAKEMLLLPENSGYTIESIALECGFRSRSTFFLAFKRIEGKTPSQWLSSQKSNK